MNLRQIFLSSKRSSQKRLIKQQQDDNVNVTDIDIAQSSSEAEQQLLQFIQNKQADTQLSYNTQCQIIDLILSDEQSSCELKRLFFVEINNYFFNCYKINMIMEMIVNDNNYDYLQYYYNTEAIHHMDQIQYEGQLQYLYNQDQMPFQQILRYIYIFQQLFLENEKFNGSFKTLVEFINKFTLAINFDNFADQKAFFEYIETQLNFIFSMACSFMKEEFCNYLDNHQIIYQIYDFSIKVLELYTQVLIQQSYDTHQPGIIDEMSEMQQLLKQKQLLTLQIILQIIQYSKQYNLIQLLTYDYLSMFYDRYHKIPQICVVLNQILYVLISKNPMLGARLAPFLLKSIRSTSQQKRSTSVECIIALLKRDINYVEQIGKKKFAQFISKLMEYEDFVYYENDLLNIAYECCLMDNNFQTYLQQNNVDIDEQNERLVMTS